MITGKWLVFLLFLFFTAGAFSQSEELLEPHRIERTLFDHYKKLNDREKRLPRYKDSDEMLAAKLVQLRHINRSRRAFRVQTLKLDILASRVANKISREAAENRFSGHWNTRGEKPYHRYALAGGCDHVVENSAAFSIHGTDFSNTIRNHIKYMKKAHDAFMAERPPRDGHKRACIDRHHNHVGIGSYISGGEFRYYEEYIDRYLEFTMRKIEVEKNNRFVFSAKPLSPDRHIYAVLVWYEPFPEPMAPEDINKRLEYKDAGDVLVSKFWPWMLKNRKKRDGSTRLSLKFSDPGYYYIHIYLSDKKDTRTHFASTEGKLQASGLVVKVI
jgi:uncharacterized protein YkwD